jgi:peptide/nickel transport system substrate-binding protein
MKRIRARSLLALALLAAACRTGPPTPARPLVIAVPWELDTLDPHAKNFVATFAVVSQFYEPLVSTDAEMHLQPCLASRWENPDPSTWVFHLRRNVVFHGGKPLRAEDVVYTIERLLTDNTLEMGGYVLYIASVRARDDYTVEIRTQRPVSVLLNKLRFVEIIPKGSAPGLLATRPDGTGPYRLATWKGNEMKLAVNERYWGIKPEVPRVDLHLARSPDAALAELLDGRAQLVLCPSKARAAALSPDRFRIRRRPNIFVKYMSYDLARDETPYCSARPNPFKDPRVREAIDLAIDRRALIAGLPTEAVPASQLVPPFIFGYDSKIPESRPDLPRARELMAQAGLQAGFDVTLDVRRIFSDAALLVAAALRPIGIRVTLRVAPDKEFFARMDRRDSTFHLSRFGCLTGDLSDILDNALHTPDPQRHFGIHNYVGYSNPDVDRAIEESSRIQAINTRRNALQKISEMLVKDRVWISLYVDEDVYALDRRLEWQPRNDGLILAADIRLAR